MNKDSLGKKNKLFGINLQVLSGFFCRFFMISYFLLRLTYIKCTKYFKNCFYE
jgi:hypothetical protein